MDRTRNGFWPEPDHRLAGVLLGRQDFVEHSRRRSRRHHLADQLLAGMKRKTFQSGRAALDLIEDAVHLLRTTPASVWIAYYAGAVPFVLGLLYFWADMSCGAYAARRCPASALG